jgi:hypothetical protein
MIENYRGRRQVIAPAALTRIILRCRPARETAAFDAAARCAAGKSP